MTFPEVNIDLIPVLPIEKFREMDYLSVENYHLPIELMMENAGLNLARLVASFLSDKKEILIGVGKGNNGGGGLVAARRLAAWGYPVYLDIPDTELSRLTAIQLKRALTFRVKLSQSSNPSLFIDAYFGFSQRLPLPVVFEDTLEKANQFKCPKISLDLPSGFNNTTSESLFLPDIILTLAALKEELLPLTNKVKFYIADLGIPLRVYQEFNVRYPKEFSNSSILKIVH